MGQRETMNIIGHLSDMRKRLIVIIAFFVMSLIFCFLFVEDIYYFLASKSGEKLAILGPLDILSIYVKLSGVGAIAATIPVAAHQIWCFVVPALTEKEKKVTLMYIPALFFLFVLGVAFAYFILFPLMYSFVLGLSQGNFDLVITANDYFSFMLSVILPFGFLFEMPAAVLFLSHLGIVNPHRLAKMRKPAYFLLSVLSISITPPDWVSDVLVIIPLIALYEVSITLSRVVYRKREQEEANSMLIV